jgi:hypothetical protein
LVLRFTIKALNSLVGCTSGFGLSLLKVKTSSPGTAIQRPGNAYFELQILTILLFGYNIYKSFILYKKNLQASGQLQQIS